MASQDDEFLQSLLAAFAIEAAEHVQALSHLLLRLEEVGGKGDTALVEEIYREAHSLKGAARAVNLLPVETVCQALETVFAAWKKGQLAVTPELFDALYQGVDTVSDLLGSSASTTPPQVASIAQRLNLLAHGTTSEPLSADETPTPNTLSPSTPAALPANGPENKTVEASLPFASLPYEPLSALSFLVHEEPPEESASTPEPPSAPPPSTPHPIQERLPPVAPSVHTPASTGLPSSVPSQSSETAPLPRAPLAPHEETVRVATSRLDGMLLQAEEMLLIKQSTLERAADLRRITAQFSVWRKEWNKVLPDFRAADAEGDSNPSSGMVQRILDFLEWNRGYVQSLEEQITLLARTAETDRRATSGLVDNLLEDAKKLLMLPFSHLIGIFPKMVRDLARHQEKEVTLDIQGSEVQIDKRILEELKDPLIHLLRNSVDHGIETSQERIATRKPTTATITLRMIQKSGSEVEVQVSDDGRGINAEAVKASAIKNGLLLPEKADLLSQAEVFDLIFQSSLSTSPIITEISGRGLGMAIVREKVEKLGGRIQVESELGQGTTFRISLPLTLATFRGVLVEVQGQIFVLPATEVERVVRVPIADVRRVHNRETITLPRATRKESERNLDVLPFLPLAGVLELTRGTSIANQKREKMRLAVVLAGGEQRVAFEVDAVLSEQEVLVKPFSRPLVRVRNVAGATILASGKAVPILNVDDILASSARYIHLGQGISSLSAQNQNSSNDWREEELPAQKSILVAEDSITSRMLFKNILESAGYKVTTAVDGLDALTTLQNDQYDLVVSDVDMPRLNGLELTAKIRENDRFTDLPVILVTARSTREDRERGVDVGANAYIVKSTFNQDDLLQVVRRLI